MDVVGLEFWILEFRVVSELAVGGLGFRFRVSSSLREFPGA